MLIGTIWRTLVDFVADPFEDPLLTDPPAEPCGRFIECQAIRNPIQTPLDIPPYPYIRRDDIIAALGRAVIIADTSAIYSVDQRKAIAIMAVYLEETLGLPEVHRRHWIVDEARLRDTPAPVVVLAS
jgi:hypothetical protein